MRKVIDYIVLTNMDQQDLGKVVKNFLMEDWELKDDLKIIQGDLTTHTRYVQVMIKVEE